MSERKTFGARGDRALEALYASVGAETTQERITVLKMQLGGEFNFYGMGGELDEGMKLACLEYDYLERIGAIEMVLA